MSAAVDLDSTSQLTHAQLRGVFEQAHTASLRVGLDYELMPYRLLDGGTVYYDRGVKPLMLALAAKYDVAPILKNHILVGIDTPVGRLRYGPGAQLNVELLGGLTLGHALSRQLPILYKEGRTFESISVNRSLRVLQSRLDLSTAVFSICLQVVHC